MREQNASLKWIRLNESGIRLHAVFHEAYGLQFTYCGRSSKTTETTERPRARCASCKSRIAHPYLIPETLRGIAAGTVSPIAPKRREPAKSNPAQGKLYA